MESNADPRYRPVSDAAIGAAAADGDPQRAALMLLANDTLGRAAEMAACRAPRLPKFHEAGWTIALETPRGVVGLWSCWLRDGFRLAFARGLDIGGEDAVDRLVADALGMGLSEAAAHVAATAVEPGYQGEYKDDDKPLEQNACGQTIAYCRESPRRWARYSGPRLPGGGRVWVDYDLWSQSQREFPLVRPDSPDGFAEVRLGHHNAQNILTYPFDEANRYAPDAPTTAPEAIQPCLDGFLALLCAVASRLGGATAAHICYEFTLVPEQLGELGYADARWLKGSPDARKGWGNERVLAARGEEHLLLVSGNSLVPWRAVRRVPVSDPGPKELRALLTF